MGDGWRTERLTNEHELGHLDSGRPAIDEWLARHALRLQTDNYCRTQVWVDNQAPYVYGFFSLTPHQLIPDEETRISGHAGGVLSGYLIAKFGINQRASRETTEVEYETRKGQLKTRAFPNPVLLLIDAIVEAEKASRHGGGRYAFIDTANEPDVVLDAVAGIGFTPIKPEGSTLWFIKLKPFGDAS